MIQRDIELLEKRTKEKAKAFLAQCSEEGVAVFLFETVRDKELQEAYCAQGRKPLTVVNTQRIACGIYQLTAEENTRTITDDPPMGLETVYLGRGHGNGTAFDIVPIKKGGGFWWGAPKVVWEKIGAIGESLGLEWGGRWKTWDGPHFQLPRSLG